MQMYLSKLIRNIKEYDEGPGIEMMTFYGRKTVKARLLAVAVDLPAKAIVANMKQYNGKFGCHMCFAEGATPPNCPLHRYYPFGEYPSRTHDSIMCDARQAVTCGDSVRGVKGASPLVFLPYIDLTTIFPVDWMHCVLLGATKAMLNLWFSKDSRGTQFYMGSKVSMC
ncbi:uncharacterized protein [Antedon mediterranea]|uniref:uncharacterized protein n=1 Tax=Antedon mediterranea TaxID=105859 RepID=UPI003AF8097E